MNLNFEQLLLEQEAKKSTGRVAFAARFFVFYAGIRVQDANEARPRFLQFSHTLAEFYGAQINLEFCWPAYRRSLIALLPFLSDNQSAGTLVFAGHLCELFRLLSFDEQCRVADLLWSEYV
jgi:hypothetical protein